MRDSSRIDTARIAFIIGVFMLLITAVHSVALNPEQTAAEIITALADSLVISNPVVLDIRCGEWTPVLERELRRRLLLRNTDIRETNITLVKDNNEWLPIAMESDWGVNGEMLLQMLKLEKADILEMNMEQSVETGEKRNLISYSRYRMPVYHFTLKQIELPEQRLLSLTEYKLSGNPEVENPGSLLAMKWYEPILASAILGSLVYMLWTLK